MTIATTTLAGLAVPAALAATEPPEERLGRRDAVRLLVAHRGRLDHARFVDLAEHLDPGDLIVVNDSATLPAAVDGSLADGRPVVVHFSTKLDDGTWVVEVRSSVAAHGPVWSLTRSAVVRLVSGATVTLLAPYPDAGVERTRLWTCRPSAQDVSRLLRRVGRPIRYAYVPQEWPLACYQTMFARVPGSAEMPSAGRPFTGAVVASLARRGIGIAAVTLHTGVSSAESGEPPTPERFVVPARTARLVNRARRDGHRVVATGTTATRALEAVSRPGGQIEPGGGWTDLVLGPERQVRAVDGLITGWHVPGSSHLGLLQAVVGADVVEASYAAAVAHGYLWHEFGDSALLLRG